MAKNTFRQIIILIGILVALIIGLGLSGLLSHVPYAAGPDLGFDYFQV